MAEYLDLFDRELRPTGEKWERNDSVPIPEGRFHYVVNILCRNKDGKILITQRHPDKPYGGWWEVSGGSVQAGEKPPALLYAHVIFSYQISDQTIPWAFMASATFKKPAILAPAT